MNIRMTQCYLRCYTGNLRDDVEVLDRIGIIAAQPVKKWVAVSLQPIGKYGGG